MERGNIPEELLGKPIKYWVELDRLAKEKNLDKVIDDLAIANAKIEYYEMLINRLNNL